MTSAMLMLLDDLRHSARNLGAHPGFTVVAALTLALGIGSTSTIFSWINATLLDPIPGVAQTSDLVSIMRGERSMSPVPPFSYPDYCDVRRSTRSFTGILAYHDTDIVLMDGTTPEAISGMLVSANYFDLLRLRPAIGRFFAPEEEAAEGGAPVAVLAHHLWRSHFGSDPSVVGRSIEMNGERYTVVGVAPRGFQGVQSGLRSDVFLPLAMDRRVNASNRLSERGEYWLELLGRLPPGKGIGQAEQETDRLMRTIVELHPDSHRGPNPISLDPVWRSPFGANVYAYRTLPMLLGLAAVVLLLACANVANLQLVRLAGRRREIAVRLSMGASRGRVVRQLLVETVVLSLLGGALAALFTAWSAGSLGRFIPPINSAVVVNGRMDARVLLVTCALAAFSGVVFGVLPALRSTRLAPAAVLKEEAGRSSAAPHKGRLSSALVVAQLSLSLVLLVAAGLFIRSLRATRDFDPGFDPEGVLLASLETSPGTRFTREDAFAFQKALIERVKALPGVESATLAEWVPLSLRTQTETVEPAGYRPRPHEEMDIRRAFVGPGYFHTMRIPLASGRDFTAEDDEDSERVAIVNQAFVERYWRGQEPVGNRVRTRDHWYSVVGVTPNTAYLRPGEPPQPLIYLPLLRHWRWQPALHVRVSGDPRAFAPLVERAVRALHPGLPLFGVTTLRRSIEMATVLERVASTFVGAFALVALALAAVGVYGVIAYASRQRTQEIAIRMALGAQRREVLQLVMRRGLVLTAAGLLIGLPAALAASRLLESHLFGVSALDPLTFCSVTALLAAVALGACYLPARRAAGIQPSAALHEG